MPHFDALKIYSCGKNIVRKGEIICNKQFLLSSQYFLPFFCTFFLNFHLHFEMSSAICFNLDQSKLLSSGNGLILLTSIHSLFSKCFYSTRGSFRRLNQIYNVDGNWFASGRIHRFSKR